MCAPLSEKASVHSHPIGSTTRAEALTRRAALRAIGGAAAVLSGGFMLPPVSVFAQGAASATAALKAAEIHAAFAAFATTVATRFDDRWFYVESHGMPDHPLMVGIRAWQQQVPIPQDYTGANAYRFPIEPTPAASPLSGRSHFFRGAMAIAADGIAMFNPIKEDGVTDTYLGGELDEFGGHSGRQDDYHYHVAPLFLQKTLGNALPIAYALDGYPIFGPNETDGTLARNLDPFNGHSHGNGGAYHYHASPTYPYHNGGFHGQVVERDGEVDPQPVARGVRPATMPLRGATIIGFERNPPGGYSLTYRVGRDTFTINYRVDAARNGRFEFVDAQGVVRVEDYAPGRGGPGGNGGGPRPGGQGGSGSAPAVPPPRP